MNKRKAGASSNTKIAKKKKKTGQDVRLTSQTKQIVVLDSFLRRGELGSSSRGCRL